MVRTDLKLVEFKTCFYQPSSRSIRGNICSDIQSIWTERNDVHAATNVCRMDRNLG